MSKPKMIEYNGTEEEQLLDLFLSGQLSESQVNTAKGLLALQEKRKNNARLARLREVTQLKDVTPAKLLLEGVKEVAKGDNK